MQQQQQQSQPSQFLSLYDRSPQPRPSPANSTMASIWAPQPQPSEVTWPRAIEAFARCVPQSREDTMGNVEALGPARNASGFIGGGPATPDLRADSHVEQLLRTLNLNSPELQPPVVASSSPKSVASAESNRSRGGRGRPIPTPLDLSFGSNSSKSTSNTSASISMTSGSMTTSTENSSLLSVSHSIESVHQQQDGIFAPTTTTAVASCPDSPDTDFSPLSFSSALLTPLDSPHSHSPIHGVTAFHSPIRAAHLHSHGLPLHSPTQSFQHSPAQSIPGSPHHSPNQLFGLGYAKEQQRFAYGGYRDAFNSEPPSPYGSGVSTAGFSPGALTHPSYSSRFLPLPPTPPGAPIIPQTPILENTIPANKSALFAADFGSYYPQALSSGGDGAEHWIRGEVVERIGNNTNANSAGRMGLGGLGLGLGVGFAQGQPVRNLRPSAPVRSGFVVPSSPGSANFGQDGFNVGHGLGADDLHALRGSLVYQQQQLAQQQQQVQQLLLHQQQQSNLAQQQQQDVPTPVNGTILKTTDNGFEGHGRRSSDTLSSTSGHSPSGGGYGSGREGRNGTSSNEPINFLSLLHPSSSPPYATFVSRIIKNADQQASIFLQQKLKVAGAEERSRILDAICARGAEMMMHRFGNWAVQRCLEAATTPEERRKIVACLRGRVVDLATNCYGCHVLQKALDCEEEEVRLLIVSELLMGDPAQTLVNKHASHVWSKIMELSWTSPAPPIFAYVNKSLKGKWAALACHETGSLVVQHAFENLEDSAKEGIVDELLGQGPAVFGEVAKSQWGSYCIQHILEHGSEKHRQMALDHLLAGLLEFASNEQGNKSVVKALKEGGKDTLDKVVKRMCEPAKGARRAMIVDLALSLTGSQLIASVLPNADKDQRAALYDCIRGHIVTLRGCKTGSKVIWLFDRMTASPFLRILSLSDLDIIVNLSPHRIAFDTTHHSPHQAPKHASQSPEFYQQADPASHIMKLKKTLRI
ncbi:ARM repeat-containing protein [Mycena indigotica]|uniref:ARM repeat-containing protein n=1 Tax=Mycena indigotica TaxID=2126181 RepID=A0A8H6STJ3_9AGAR|nr:ARM repeat-containing protein [Mycena indigotica]KAF7304107.1 ARM repeat-containing protein [Mycena indigotica]